MAGRKACSVQSLTSVSAAAWKETINATTRPNNPAMRLRQDGIKENVFPLSTPDGRYCIGQFMLGKSYLGSKRRWALMQIFVLSFGGFLATAASLFLAELLFGGADTRHSPFLGRCGLGGNFRRRQDSRPDQDDQFIANFLLGSVPESPAQHRNVLD